MSFIFNFIHSFIHRLPPIIWNFLWKSKNLENWKESLDDKKLHELDQMLKTDCWKMGQLIRLSNFTLFFPVEVIFCLQWLKKLLQKWLLGSNLFKYRSFERIRDSELTLSFSQWFVSWTKKQRFHWWIHNLDLLPSQVFKRHCFTHSNNSTNYYQQTRWWP